ncbi:DNA-binding protein [Mesorhizobium sp.]|uniref:DNA-binding protein n=1 Tax=Mesorhizobium sp. TaxID=1871066 RepID=UPI000FE4A5A7|nr:DNA-binding protein [Mesorhizobium sp.]RWO85762.1 MAG: DNA-binding protein [Mesorhizobium sp.]
MEVNPEETDLDLIWGSPAIARAIKRKPRITAYLLEKGEIPGATKVLGKWVISRHKLREKFGMAEVA